MKKLLLALILTFINTSAMAEWDLLTESQDGDFKVYADLSSIRKTDNGVRMWSIYDYKTVHGVAGIKYLSNRNLDEYDCKDEKKRGLTSTWFSDNMGNGEILHTNSDTQSWLYIAPNTIDEALYEVACSKQ